MQLQQDMYWLLLFIPKTVASKEDDVRGSVLVRQSGSSKLLQQSHSLFLLCLGECCYCIESCDV